MTWTVADLLGNLVFLDLVPQEIVHVLKAVILPFLNASFAFTLPKRKTIKKIFSPRRSTFSPTIIQTIGPYVSRFKIEKEPRPLIRITE